MISNREKGNAGENFVCKYLEDKGYRVLCRNFVAAGGEIDVILEKNEFVVFTEVKLRNKKTDLWPAGAVDAKKRARIKKAAQFFLDEYALVGYIAQLQVRFDVAEVIFDNGKININYIENAFI